jgi:hypothetical protein
LFFSDASADTSTNADADYLAHDGANVLANTVSFVATNFAAFTNA